MQKGKVLMTSFISVENSLFMFKYCFKVFYYNSYFKLGSTIRTIKHFHVAHRTMFYLSSR